MGLGQSIGQDLLRISQKTVPNMYGLGGVNVAAEVGCLSKMSWLTGKGGSGGDR